MLRPLLLAPATALLLTGTAFAQTAPSATATPPLMTAPRPDDQPATGQIISPQGVSGEAPSLEVQNPAPPVTGAQMGVGQGSSPPVAALPSAALNPEQARAMVGTELRTRDGQPAGRILDFTMDRSGDRVDRIVMAPNEVLGLGEKLVAVPAGTLANGPDGPMLDIGQDELDKAPIFAYGDEPTLTRPESRQPGNQ
ncbi:hypothetical protein TSH100_16385 [Azospirillum sp. TSH100]|uniref:PRC-barrel domain-containing protein n=1 Tax=Azospirillum sp. TSH100 TaxID=652764 RepID=UPI000D618719|nr:PRC-barrel domain-containing protein [Azospirillum sp. TSH100]PWC84899.1 hypothetical protein TSH100_16385 [Azospirillum sp. TSH100]QCG89452.1 PRC-barrel domain containing protein [Azospirillum sp. TSH100]